ncbi:MAG TPA: protein kinase [Gemmatimonadales bacterium]
MTDLRSQLQEGLSGSYALERELGRGGMATVFLAQDLKHDRPVALKVLHPELASSLGPERFLREIKLAARLQHPHILSVHDSGVVVGRQSSVASEHPTTDDSRLTTLLWFTMPYVEGESLRERLRREGQLSIADAVRITREAALALDYAHRHGAIHRDIKPENILLADGQALVADFGIARALGAGDERLTETGLTLGTPAYMSPEQAAGDKGLDARTDIYSLGIVLYEMLAGETPFTAPTAQAMIARRMLETPRPLRELRDTVPDGVAQAGARALARSPADRFASAAEFARALDEASVRTSAPAPVAAATVATPPASRAVSVAARRRVPLALAVGFLLGLGVLFGWLRSHGGAEPTGPGTTRRLAVLPFENLGDSGDEYFADGVTDEVRGKLAGLPGLQVTARSSSNQYKKTTKSPQEIGRDLGVDYLLTGTVRWEKSDGTNHVRVSPELIQVSTGSTKWQQPFDAALTDVFQVQADMAGEVAQALDVALGTPQKTALAAKPTGNAAAYDAYLKGEAASQALGNGDPMAMRTAIGFYEQAVALDSGFVQAWVQLSRAHSLLYVNGGPDPQGGRRAREAAERAIGLAPNQPGPHLALGDYFTAVSGEQERARAAYEAGLRLAPNDAELLGASALVEVITGTWEQALEHFTRARDLDPRSMTIARRLGYTLVRLRRYPEALAESNRGLAIAPDNPALLENKAMVYLGQGDLEGARRVIREAPAGMDPTNLTAVFANYWDLYWVLPPEQQSLLLRLTPSAFPNRASWAFVLAQAYRLRGDLARTRAYADSARAAFEASLAGTPDDPQFHVLRGLALAYLGRKAEAIAEGERGVALLPIAEDTYSGPYLQHQLVRIYIEAGEPEKALDRLEPLLRMPYYLSPGWLRIDPNFDSLRKNARFEALVDKST